MDTNHTNNGSSWNLRKQTLVTIYGCGLLLALLILWGILMPDSAYAVNFMERNLAPSMAHPFGTDWMGRDMLARAVKGLTTSIQIGLFASFISSIIAVFLGTLAATRGRWIDEVILWFIDLFQGVPHIIFLMLISLLMGKGVLGILVGVAVTHWTNLARIVRAEILSLKMNQYILVAEKLGTSKWKIAYHHMFPHIFPQFVVGLILLFPHAILHESALTFLGFGIPPEQPAIGVILAESMRYITGGLWWLAVFPGMLLLAIVLMFDGIGTGVKRLWDPKTGQE